jgi:CubicO group peptidase (beta-lactamase class C family)
MTGSVYRNTNYYLTSLMIEKLGGFADYRDAMKQYVFAPAGMTQSGFIDAPPSVPLAKAPFDTAGSAYNKPNWPRGAGDVVSNVTDLMKWHSALVNKKLFGVQSQAAMFTPPQNSNYAMGWVALVTPPYRWYTHNGVIAGFTSHSAIFVNGSTKAWVSVAVLANNDGVPVDKLALCYAQLAMDSSPTLKGLQPSAKAACGISAKAFGP